MSDNRNVKQWKQVLSLWSHDLSFAQVSKLTPVSRQRCHQIINQAKKYASEHDDELSAWINITIGFRTKQWIKKQRTVTNE